MAGNVAEIAEKVGKIHLSGKGKMKRKGNPHVWLPAK
jgi:hypothetical protein